METSAAPAPAAEPSGEPPPSRPSGVRTFLERASARWRRLVTTWRRSLQLRAVATTVLLSALAMLGAGIFLSNQIADGLFQERFGQVQEESVRGLNQVKSNFESAATTDRSSTVAFVNDTLKLVEGDGASVQRDFILTPLPSSENIYVTNTASGGLTTAVIPASLAVTVRDNPGVYWESISFPHATYDTPGLAFGTKVQLPPGREYALYLVYDLESVQQTLDFIHRVLAIGGLLLLCVTGGIAWYTTRLVVRPVSNAALVSEKLAAGELQERLEVHGEDEIARLGTSFNRMATSLQDQITQLATLSQMQQRFVSDVSHELRTPLTTVRMAAEVLHDAREEFDPINRRSAELLYNQVERFQTLLNDLLEISRFDAGVAVLDAEVLDLVPVVRRVVETASMHAENLGSELRVHVPDGGCTVEMDHRRIERIIRNLVMNAVEHGEGEPIDITVAQDEHAVAVTVRDHGIGMDPEDAARVFDRFWRGDPARARTTGGSGLGLSIATEDTRLHGGWLQAWGEKGDGACFRLTLPRNLGDPVGSSPLPLAPHSRLRLGQSLGFEETSPHTASLPTLPSGGFALPGSILRAVPPAERATLAHPGVDGDPVHDQDATADDEPETGHPGGTHA
ncbi:two-component system sensor histidine kinase MtrB [Arthrobacter rhombi]|uniref:MtrAB system histidine kinase MtrB n=1 Tax=Arthrobacter rhombi TaxID=71253 RepID=UPI0031DC0397